MNDNLLIDYLLEKGNCKGGLKVGIVRKGAAGLSIIVRQEMDRHPGSGGIFDFCSK